MSEVSPFERFLDPLEVAVLRSVFRLGLAVASALVLLAACSGPESSKLPVVGPTAPTPVGPQEPATFFVSGTVWLHDATGVAPAQSGTVFGWTERPAINRTTGPVGITADGRYGFAILKDTTRVSVFGGPGHQPCAAAKATSGNTTLDVHRVVDKNQLGANLPAALLAQTPTLSGVVYESTPQGRQPIPNAWVTLDGEGGLGLLVADTLTDAQGRYVLCSVPQTPMMAIVAGAQGFDLAEIFGPALANKTTLDIEMRRR